MYSYVRVWLEGEEEEEEGKDPVDDKEEIIL